MRTKGWSFFAIASIFFTLSLSAGLAIAQTNLLPCPSGQNVITCSPSASATCHHDPNLANPLGLGAVASGGDTLSLQVALNGFSAPVDIYVALYVPTIDPTNVFLLTPDLALQPLSAGFSAWHRNATSGVDQTIFSNIPKSLLPNGTYTFGIAVSPAGRDLNDMFLWLSSVEIATTTLNTVHGVMAGWTGNSRFPAMAVHENGEILYSMADTGSNANALGVRNISNVAGAFWSSPTGESVLVYFNANGQPDHGFIADHIIYFDNYTSTTVDIGVVAPDGTVRVERNVPLPIGNVSSVRLSASSSSDLATNIRIASAGFSAFACSVAVVGVFFPPVGLAGGIACAASVAISVASFAVEDSTLLEATGLSLDAALCPIGLAGGDFGLSCGAFGLNLLGATTDAFSISMTDRASTIQETQTILADPDNFTWYRDTDGDRYAADASAMSAIQRPSAFYFLASELIAISGDCDDNDSTRHPGATEMPGDGIDQDCNGTDATDGGNTITISNPPMTLALIPAGTFTMGSPSDEPGRDSNEVQHSVTITQPFYMQTTEVTQAQWQAVMGNNPSSFSNCPDCPVERVSWVDAQEFIQRLNLSEGTDKYRLPTEAEWEYAARAGSTTAFANGGITTTGCSYDPNLDATGWYCGNSGDTTHPVAQKQPNAWGLYDMHGNVWEWCSDWYGNYPSGTVTDPMGPASGSYRVRRGGSGGSRAGRCRSADRGSGTPGSRSSFLGFRLARTF